MTVGSVRRLRQVDDCVKMLEGMRRTQRMAWGGREREKSEFGTRLENRTEVGKLVCGETVARRKNDQRRMERLKIGWQHPASTQFNLLAGRSRLAIAIGALWGAQTTQA